MKMKAQKRIKPHIQRLPEAEILKECQYTWTISFLLVQKPGTSEYRSVQDLRTVNNIVTTLHPTVLNPYILLSPSLSWHTKLVLKDAFICIPLSKVPKKYLLLSGRNLRKHENVS